MWSAKALRWLAWFHRWAGVALCLLFTLWFASGAVMVFVPFPSLSGAERLAAAEPIRPSAVSVPPGRALASAGGGDELRLRMSGGKAVYIVGGEGARDRAIDAGTGVARAPLDPRAAAEIASSFAGVRVRQVRGPIEYDQWVVHNQFDPWRPFYRVSLADTAGTQLYVARGTGEVVQRTTRAERAWNWAGSVPHWLYFTVLRKSFAAWDQTVWWVALVGLATGVAGAYLGVYRTVRRMRGKRPDWSPFRGWLRWHHGLGLGVGVFVLTWIFSGWLSMDHGRIFSRGTPQAAAEARFHGAPLSAALSSAAVPDLRPLGTASEIRFGVVGGRPLASAEGAPGAARVLLLDDPSQSVAAQLPAGVLAKAVAAGWPSALGPAPAAATDDRLYRAADDMPPRAVRFPLERAEGAAVYLDPVAGRIVAVVDPSRKAYAWAYYALHTFKFPGLIDHPLLRRLLVLAPLLLGLGFSITGLVVAIKRIRIAAA